MFCSNCGQEVADNSRFCHNCGATLSADPTPAEANPNPQQYQNMSQPMETRILTSEEPINHMPPAAPVNQAPPVTPVAPEDPGASTGRTAFILGLVGVIAGAICSCTCAFLGGILPMIASILAIVFGNQAKQKSAAVGLENKQGKTAVILGIVGIAVIIVFIIINAIVGAVVGAAYDYNSYYYDFM